MAQKSVSKVNEELLSLLKVDNNGWNVSLFEDQVKITTSLCVHCNGVCCDAVELGCDHQDDEIYPHCKNCLNQLITDNNNNCAINSHSDPIIIPIRFIRHQISKSTVNCPYSVQYKKLQNNDNGQIVDTIGGDEKEGIMPNNNNNNNIHHNGCDWSGYLNDLIIKHIGECVKKYNPSFTQNIVIQKLEDKNKKLKEIIDDKQQQIEQLQQQITAQSQQNTQLQQELVTANEQIEILQTELTKTKSVIQTKESKVEQQCVMVKELLINVENKNKETNQLKQRNDDEKQINKNDTISDLVGIYKDIDNLFNLVTNHSDDDGQKHLESLRSKVKELTHMKVSERELSNTESAKSVKMARDRIQQIRQRRANLKQQHNKTRSPQKQKEVILKIPDNVEAACNIIYSDSCYGMG